MAAQNISITPELLAHARKMVETGKYGSISDYMRALVRRDLAEQEYNERLLELIQEGLDSGPGVEVTPEGIGELIQKGIDQAREEKLKQAG